jgi:chromosomal replication initiator protein
MELRSQPELMPAWREVRASVRSAVGDSTYRIWLESLEPDGWDGSVLRVTAPAETTAWVAERFGQVVERSVRSVFGPGARVSFAPGDHSAARPGTSPVNPSSHRSQTEPIGSFNPRYSFEEFVMGDANRLAHAAALAVAENPGQAINPLFLHGPPGLGKTHLLHAIGNYLATYSRDAVVRYTTVETFTNGFITALGSRSVERFKQLHRDVDVLLIDDVQFLASKAKTEEEFFHTFNAIYDAGRQLVLTCDRLPSRLDAIAERLRDRFQAGLVAELSAPDHATRVAILRKRAALDGLRIPDPRVLDVIADRVRDNVRSLEGALIRVVAVQSLTGRPFDVVLANEVLAEITPGATAGELTVGQIQKLVASRFALSITELCSPSRAAKVAWPRQLAIHLTRELTGQSLQSIGQAFGGRNHATALHACRRVSEQVRRSPELAAELADLERALLSAQDAAADDRRS